MAGYTLHVKHCRVMRLGRAIVAVLALGGGVVVLARAFIARAPARGAAAAVAPALAAGHRHVDSLRWVAMHAARPDAVALEDAVVLGYAERLRLGLGGPFRLADFALADPRLRPQSRAAVAWALLDAARRGAAHATDPAALAAGIPDRAGGAPHHLALIEREIAAHDPRAGELAVRLAYQLAAAERLVPPEALPVIAQTAALVRDREIARRDVARLIDAASLEGRSPLVLIPERRAARMFDSERPAAAVQGIALETDALRRVAPMLDSIRVLAGEGARGDTTRALLPRTGRTPLLPPHAAERLAAEGATLPPQGPVVVAMRTHSALIGASLPRSATTRRWLRSLTTRITHDEALAAEHARLVWSGTSTGAVARATLAAAVGMRAYAQEAPWFPGMAGPTADELRRVHGFAEVKFSRGVPAAWRPYYRRMLASAAADLRRVVPTATFDGLRVRVETAASTAPLAVHDPAARVLHLPMSTAAGVLAHELAHDLDWQAARRLYARRSGYSTDYAVRARNDRVAESVQGPTSARLIPPTHANGFRPPHDRRPAEVFARNFDWFVAVSLAREGRVNGYLSAVQDEVLTGYATVSAREADGRGAQALMRLLGDVAFVSAPARDWFLEQWGPTRTLRSYALVRELMATPVPAPTVGSAGLFAAPRLPSAGLDAAGSSLGVVAACDGRGALSAERPQVALARLAAESRARGLLAIAARETTPAGRSAWAQSVLRVGPWSPVLAEHATRQLRDALLQGLASRADLDSPFALAGADCKTESPAAP